MKTTGREGHLLRRFGIGTRMDPAPATNLAPESVPDNAAPAPDTAARAAGVAAFVVLTALYLSTAAPGAWWGDGLEFACAAKVLGIPHPPGYPLYVMIGAGWTRALGVAGIEPGRALAIFSALCCASSAAGIGLLAGRLARRPREPISAPLVFGVALAVGVSRTVWDHATFAEVYPLALLFAVAITALCASTIRSSQGASLRLVALGGLFGLALGHHYSLIALAPLVATAAWIGIADGLGRGTGILPVPIDSITAGDSHRQDACATTTRDPANDSGIVAAISGLALVALPFALAQLVWLYPLLRARAGPLLNWGDPSTLERFLWMVGGGDYGRMPQPPGAPTGVAKILAGLARWLGWWGGEWSPAHGALGAPFAIPIVAIGLGAALVATLVWLLARGFLGSRAGADSDRSDADLPESHLEDRTIRLMTPGAILAVSFGAVVAVGYPIPDLEGYFLPALPMLALVVAGWVRGAPENPARTDRPTRASRSARLGAGLTVLAAALAILNRPAFDKRWDDGPTRWAERALASLPPNAVLVTRQGVDTEILSLWRAQKVRQLRPDVTVIGSGFLFQGWYAGQLRAEELANARILSNLPFPPPASPTLFAQSTPSTSSNPPTPPPSVPWMIRARPIGTKPDFDATLHAGIVIPALERGRRVFTTWTDAEILDRMNPRPFVARLLPDSYRRRCAYRFALPSPVLYELTPDPRGFERERADFRARFGEEPPPPNPVP